MRTYTTRTTTRLALVLTLTTALFAAGCGSEKADTSTAPDFTDSPSPPAGRALDVAGAWDGSEAAKAWRSGYHPMGEPAQAPGNGFHSDADKHAFGLKNYVLSGQLPTTAPEKGQVKWEGGGSLTFPLLDARRTYTALGRNGSSDGPHLTVTGAKLGEMTMATGRGPATVPAWLFTLEGYDEPLKRAAVEPSKLPKSPIGQLGESPTELYELQRMVDVSEDGRTVTVVAHHGTCDDGPRVEALETDGSVVLSATVAGGDYEGACAAVMLEKKVKVTLDRPLGDRIVLDAYMGRPVPFGKQSWPSASWS
ncbi:hypothetical protein ACKI1I_26250 [Streptomyces turgidiscabies]|uniref:Putative lipoprotein n=1 Tax=Streptomyces turgidiscabies (strain Car8) TaxID=698760 RepID=L7FFI0_STRT8|nr:MULTISPECIES: hypothetical protein [Streptomyces]ELP70062.1 putative lipoprotein [Streptomyces turgidiscabies Car8]MDX3494170.1 hypothetical protein [Streptomyces turgidiscabies]GAQ68457.1 hypothetical protein T45_00168 [Streptomyces turgidiscabies]